MFARVRLFLKDEDGATLTEYGLLAAVLAVPMMAAFGAIAAVGGSALQTTGTGLSNLGSNP